MKTITATIAALAFFAAAPVSASAKTCSASYVHAVIGGVQKCLGRGEYCSIAHKRQYPKYGFTCTDVNGSYRLEPS
ncbi:MAG: hypothetical protein ABSC56_00395 [Solirubrobacteraceae bacterium]